MPVRNTHYQQLQPLLKERRFVLVYFYGPNCGFSKRAMPAIEAFAKKANGVEVVKISAPDDHDSIKFYGLKATPTLIMFEKGRELGRIVGYDDIMKQIQPLVA